MLTNLRVLKQSTTNKLSDVASLTAAEASLGEESLRSRGHAVIDLRTLALS